MTASSTAEGPVRSERLGANGDFRNLFCAAAATRLGTHVSYVAMPLVAIEALGAGPGEVGALAALATAASLLLGLPAGAWIDRSRKRPLMVAADLGRAALLASVPVAWWFDALTIWQMYAVVFLAGACTTAFEIAQQSLLPVIVDRERLTGANARLVTLDSSLSISGRSVAGFLVAAVGGPLAVVANAVGYAWSARFVGRIRVEPAPTEARASLVKEVAEGLRHVWGHRALRALAGAGALNNFALQLFVVMLPVVWTRSGLPTYGLGLFLAVGAVGALAGAAAARRLRATMGTARSLWVVGAVAAGPALCLPLVGPGWGVWLAAGAWTLVGAVVGMANVIGMSLRQQLTPDELLGRMNSVFRFVFIGAVALGSATAAAVGELWSPSGAMWIGAVGVAAHWIVLFAARRDLRHGAERE